MRIAKKVATLGMIGVLGISNLWASFFKPVDICEENTISLEGRLSFLWEDAAGVENYRLSENGDELGIYRGLLCIASSSQIDENQGHYKDLKIYNGAIPFILNGIYDVKAYNHQTNTIWDVQIKGYDKLGVHFIANDNLNTVPEPATLSLLGLGAVAYLYCKDKKGQGKNKENL